MFVVFGGLIVFAGFCSWCLVPDLFDCKPVFAETLPVEILLRPELKVNSFQRGFVFASLETATVSLSS